MRALSLTALLLLGAFAPTLSFAQDPTGDDATRARAKELYENGARLYEEGLYEEAIQAFEASFELSGAHVLKYNIANAYERLGRFQEALDALNSYRAFAPTEERPVLERRIRNLEKRLAEQRAAQATPPSTPPPTTAPAVTAPAPVEPAGPTRKPSVANVTLVATGGALAVGGGAVAAITWQQGQAHKDTGDRDAWERTRPINNIAFAGACVGAGLIATGLLLPGKTVSATPIPGGAMATGTWRF